MGIIITVLSIPNSVVKIEGCSWDVRVAKMLLKKKVNTGYTQNSTLHFRRRAWAQVPVPVQAMVGMVAA